jgi:hexosaminidase
MKFKILCILLGFAGITYSANPNLIPQPKEIKIMSGHFVLSNKTTITSFENSLTKEVDLLKTLLQPATGFDFKSGKASSVSNIYLKLAMPTENFVPEAYKLVVDSKKIEITAADSSGFFNAFQTLLQLLPADIYSNHVIKNKIWKTKNVEITDFPTYSWRGAMLDVSRQFYDIHFLKKYINWMAAHKLNVFHLHLTDDEGWRIEIKTYPKLTQVGAWRGPNEALQPAHGSGNKRYGGFYTQDELKGLVRYAGERNIQILPEIDVPGHSKAVAVSYPEILCDGNDTTKSIQGVSNNVWCAGNDHNFEMLDTIIGEVATIFPMKYIHIGGDEVNFKAWAHCSLCKKRMEENHFLKPTELQNYFISRIEKIVEKHGKLMMGWNEILDNSTLDKKTAVMVWTSNDAVVESVQQRHPVILSPGSYFYIDMAQGMGERGHSWATFLPIERLYSFQLPTDSLSKIYVKGVQANLWAEYLDQPAYQTEYQSYPRLCALAELAWSGNKSTFEDFEKRLNSHYDRLNAMGIHFRVPPPAVKIEHGEMRFAKTLSNSKIVFTNDSTIPTKNSSILLNNENIKSIASNPNNILLRTCYNDSLLSPTVTITGDTIGFWNPELLSKISSKTISIAIHPAKKSKSEAHSCIIKYVYGSSEIAIKKLILYKNDSVLLEMKYDKPFRLFTHSPIIEILLPGNVFSEQGNYKIDFETVGKNEPDTYGVIIDKNTNL